MSKFVVYLLVLLNFYCYGNETVVLNAFNANNVKVNIRVGDILKVKIPISLRNGGHKSLVNKDEVSDSLQLIKEAFVPLSDVTIKKLSATRAYSIFLFKAVKVTNKAQTLKFLKKNQLKKETYTLKVNVY